MYCVHCGKQMENTARFCRFCGGKLPGLEAQPSPQETVVQSPAREHGHATAATDHLQEKTQESTEEKELLTFGPIGYSITNGPWGLFAWECRNRMRFVITSRHFRSFSTFWGVTKAPQLNIPHEHLLSVSHRPAPPISWGIMELLTVKFREGNTAREVNISGVRDTIIRAHDILKWHMQR